MRRSQLQILRETLKIQVYFSNDLTAEARFPCCRESNSSRTCASTSMVAMCIPKLQKAGSQKFLHFGGERPMAGIPCRSWWGITDTRRAPLYRVQVFWQSVIGRRLVVRNAADRHLLSREGSARFPRRDLMYRARPVWQQQPSSHAILHACCCDAAKYQFNVL